MDKQFDDLIAYNTTLFEGLRREIRSLGESVTARIDSHSAQNRLYWDEKFLEFRELVLQLGGEELRQRVESLERKQH
ncbi:MAG: hypothetical protein Q7R68_03130 [Nitrospirales bacterium]|nr:hypothetical protein [Nitrospirales bacterium]